MKKTPLYLIALAALLLATACHRNDIRTVGLSGILRGVLLNACHRNDIRTEIFQIDQLRNPKSIKLIAKALHPLQGVQKITPDFEKRELVIVFNGRVLFGKNIEYALVKAGFNLPNWPANPADIAKLPEELR